MRKISIAAFLFSLTYILSGCGSDSENTPTVAKSDSVQKNPFEFYKRVEIRPGVSFEALSWGRGVDTLGGYTILMADSVRHQYKSIGGSREGQIQAFWNLDLDNDGNPELYLQTKNSSNLSDLLVFEYEGSDFNKISFPTLSSKTKSRLAGPDKFSIKGGELFRTIPVKGEKEGAADTVMNIKYVLQENSFSVKDVK